MGDEGSMGDSINWGDSALGTSATRSGTKGTGGASSGCVGMRDVL